MAVVKNRILRAVLLALGFLFLGIGFIGVAIPLIPTTGPIILSGFLFSLSSERFDTWLVENRLFGGIVRDWRAGAGFTVRAKIVAVVAIIATFTISVFFVVDLMAVRIALISLAVAIATFVVTRPTKRMDLPEPQAADC